MTVIAARRRLITGPPSAAAGSRYWFSLPPLACYKRGQVSLKSPKESRDERWLSWPSVSAANETPDGPYPKGSRPEIGNWTPRRCGSESRLRRRPPTGATPARLHGAVLQPGTFRGRL